MAKTLRRNTRRRSRSRRVKRGGMNGRDSSNASAPSMQRQRVNARQRVVGDNRSSRPTGNQDRTLRQLAELTAVPRRISPEESRILRMLRRRTPAEIDRDTRMNRELSMRPLLPTVARLQRQQEFINELRSVAPPNKKGEFDRLITSCDRDRELLKAFIRGNLSREQGVMRMNQSHHDPLLNRDLSDIKVIGELKDIVNRCSRNRIELMNIIREVYPQLSDILGASGLVQHGVARYLDYPHQPGYGFVEGALENLSFVDDEVLDIFDQELPQPRERVIERLRRERNERMAEPEPESAGILATRGVRPGSALERLLEERSLRRSLPEGMDNTALLLRSLMGKDIGPQGAVSPSDLQRTRRELAEMNARGEFGATGELLQSVLGRPGSVVHAVPAAVPAAATAVPAAATAVPAAAAVPVAPFNPELLESGYLDNGRWIKRSSPENTRYLPRMDYGSRRRSKRRSKGKRRKRIRY